MQHSGPAGKRILLVRHARPDIDPARPAGEWALTRDAGASVERLAATLTGLGMDGVVASPEPKAHATARILSASLNLPLAEDAAFREHGLDTIPWINEPDDFVAAVRDHFSRPDEAVFGKESSVMAAARFAGGVSRAMAMHRFPVIVSHGRIMCGYLRLATGVDPMAIWPTLRMPDALVVDLDGETITRVTEGESVPLFEKETPA